MKWFMMKRTIHSNRHPVLMVKSNKITTLSGINKTFMKHMSMYKSKMFNKMSRMTEKIVMWKSGKIWNQQMC